MSFLKELKYFSPIIKVNISEMIKYTQKYSKIIFYITRRNMTRKYKANYFSFVTGSSCCFSISTNEITQRKVNSINVSVA